MDAVVSPCCSPDPKVIEQNLREFGDAHDQLRWVTPEEAARALEARESLLREIRSLGNVGFHGTKVYSHRLSPGCEKCAEGTWSCLFASGRCNCHCFFCPVSQDQPDTPGTNNVDFPQVKDYVDYLRQFAFAGASISGGEPLLKLETVVRYLERIRSGLGDRIHLWMYTNGELLTPEIARRLRDAGLNEIRFNIIATGLKLDHVAKAIGIIDTVTIEIPAVPEMEEALRERIVQMARMGVKHLNLHQMRLTPHNLPKLAPRDYTFVHGESATVLESELTALRLLKWTLEQDIPLAINYCSFAYKGRYSGRAARMRGIEVVRKPYEDVTGNGYLRVMTLRGGTPELIAQAERFGTAAGWAMTPKKDALMVAQSLWDQVKWDQFSAGVAYHETRVLEALSHRRMFMEVKLNKNRSLYVERAPAAAEFMLTTEELRAVRAGAWPERLRSFEQMAEGLSPIG